MSCPSSGEEVSTKLLVTTFPQFSKLPVELRLQIWRYGVTPRPVYFEWPRTLPGYGSLRRRTQPSLLGVCQESRQLALRFYKLWGVCQRSKDCRRPQMRMEYIMYPWPPVSDESNTSDVEAYRGRHERYLERLPSCRCYPYVAFDIETFVINNHDVHYKRFLIRHEGPSQLRNIRHLSYTNVIPRWLRTRTPLSKFMNLETVTAVLYASSSTTLEDQRSIVRNYGRKMLQKCKLKNPEWKMPKLLIARSLKD
jgi:hypothetical protein